MSHLTNIQFRGLKIGDRVRLVMGAGDHYLDAVVTIADRPRASVSVIVSKILKKGSGCTAIKGDILIADISELFLLQTGSLV